MRAYRPRRASVKRWLEGAPDYVLSCHDSGPEYGDRYTVCFGPPVWTEEYGRTVPFLGMGPRPYHPQGFCQWGEMDSHARTRLPKIKWQDLPEDVRRVVESLPQHMQEG
jgi:hypothetical protein